MLDRSSQLLCLIVLAVDFSRRGGPPRIYIDPASAVTWTVVPVAVTVIVAVNVID